jgi:hypothetical protein
MNRLYKIIFILIVARGARLTVYPHLNPLPFLLCWTSKERRLPPPRMLRGVYTETALAANVLQHDN